MLESLVDGLALVLQWPAIGYLVLGVLIGLWLGAVPGLGGIVGLVIILPFTFQLDAVAAFALMLGMFAVTTTSDTIASIMLGIPGTAASQATILDGYPMAQRGEAARAFGAAFTVSAVGGVLGGIAMAVSLPLALPLILAFGSPEFFLLGVLGLTMVGTVSGGAVTKGLGAALIGLMISQVGYPVASDVPRYWFNIGYLIDGVPLVPVVLGLFGIPELLDLAVRNSAISKVPAEQTAGGGMMQGVRDAFRHKWLMLRSSAIGIYIGMLPGLGGSIADWVAYGHAVQSCKDDPRFGRGDVRGVIAPEAANNALKGGVLIPTVAIGIPGSASMAILLGALIIQGLSPGPDMLTTHLDLTFSMVWTLIIANLLGAGLLMIWSRQVAKASFIDGHLIVPGVVVFVLMGAWLSSPDLASWITLLSFGALGFIMKRSGWPRPALVLGLVLGPIMENAFVLSAQAYDGVELLTRPLFLVLAVVVALAFVFAVRGMRRGRKAGHISDQAEGAQSNPVLSLPLAGVLLAGFVAAAFAAGDWPRSARLFPTAIAWPAVLLMLLVLAGDGRSLRRLWLDSGRRIGGAAVSAFAGGGYGRSILFLLSVGAVIPLTPVLGQQATLLAFVAFYLRVWGGFRWMAVAVYAAAVWLFLFGLYDQVLHVYWIPPLFFS